MKYRRIESLVTLAVLLIVNFFTLLWLQGRSFSSVWAEGMNAPAAAPLAVVNIPRSFSYQGVLRDLNGSLITGVVTPTLRLYKDISGGTALHTENFPSTNVRAGVFSVVVGDATPINATVFDNFPLYLGISVNSDPEMLPRQRLHPVPYAMQANSAQSAQTAINLAQGGGVPNLVKLGSNALSEVRFLPNNGTVTNDTDGLTLNGGNNSTVKTSGNLTVGGSLTVNGDWSVSAILDKGDSNGGANVRSTYPLSITRYVVEAPDQGSSPDTVPVDNAILTALCQDDDGCTVGLYMRNWDNNRQPGLLAGVSAAHFSLAAVNTNKRDWDMRDVASNGAVGTDNNGAIQHAMNIYTACYFTDAEYVNAQGSDSALGFGLLNWFGAYDSTQMTCVLVIQD